MLLSVSCASKFSLLKTSRHEYQIPPPQATSPKEVIRKCTEDVGSEGDVALFLCVELYTSNDIIFQLIGIIAQYEVRADWDDGLKPKERPANKYLFKTN